MSGTGIRIIDMPDLGTITDTSSVVGDRAGSGRFSAIALRNYTTTAVVQFVDTIAALRTLSTGAPSVFVRGYWAVGDGGGGSYIKGSTGADNSGSIIVSASGTYYLQTGGAPVSVKQFGAKCDGTTNDTAAWTNAIAASTAQGFTIHHPGGNSIVVGPLALKSNTIMGVGSYYVPSGHTVIQQSMITFKGDGAGITMADVDSGGFTLEKIGFAGDYPISTGQIGLLMPDSLRTTQAEGWPTLRDVSFINFNIGIDVGNTYQGGWMYNVFIAGSIQIGYRNSSTDWYHYMVTCGSGVSIPAAVAQLFLGVVGAAPAFASGNHQFHGGAFYSGLNTVVMENSSGNYIGGAQIQNGQINGLVIGNGTTPVGSNIISGCTFSGNNSEGGTNNAGGSYGYDITVLGFAYSNTIIGCQLAAWGAPTCVAAAISCAYNSDGTVITNNTINMDNIVTPGAPTGPLAIALHPSIQSGTLDHYIINNNLAFFGQGARYPFNLLPVNMAYVSQPHTVAAELSINAGTAVLSAASGNIACSLRNPIYPGRSMIIMEATTGGGDTVVAATSGGFLNGKTTIRFNTAASYVIMTSVNGVQWLITSSSGVTLT